MKQIAAVNQLKAGLRKASMSTQTLMRAQLSGFLASCAGFGLARSKAMNATSATIVENQRTALPKELQFLRRKRIRMG